ncbi:beta-ketoacyl synthase chain length factor [Ralstonia soli]|uniref:Beta-ketoacyl synthase chain length factor n=1 Tax=Ralstonia soli TaxID=2953896 RepID=A0ABT1APP9_9RALS|nr:beta-ketoacyl synthase chain length factor [Ralstonia soli]MCO5400286.1 beta-ketoacyl synthase chain length factor [Ralstonia soli]
MPDLHWTIPVARWSCWPAIGSDSASSPNLGFIEPMVRRRLSTLSKNALHVAHDCASDVPRARIVFASRHGELRRTAGILADMDDAQPVSPTAFSLSVLNAMSGVFGIARGDTSPAIAVSAGPATLGLALLEAHAQYVSDPALPVLLVYADEPADPRFGAVADEVEDCALAILLDASAPASLVCSHSPQAEAHDADDGLTTQSQAVLHCLASRTSSTWRHADSAWTWQWREGPWQPH